MLLSLARRDANARFVYSKFVLSGILKKVTINLTNPLYSAASLFSIHPWKIITDKYPGSRAAATPIIS